VLFWDGEFMDEEDMRIPVYDYGFCYGDGCFESIAVVEGVIIDLDARIARLLRSAKAMRIEPPMSSGEIRDLVIEFAARNNLASESSGYIRPMLSRSASKLGEPGATEIGLMKAKRTGTLRVLGAMNPGSSYRGEIPVVNAILSSYERSVSTTLDPRIKPFNYSTSILALFEAQDRGARWAVFRDRNGYITEAFSANIFCVLDGVIYTSPRASCLGGLTRQDALAAACALDYELVETPLTRYDFETADEVFITSALIGVHAIGEFEGVQMRLQPPGPITTAIRDEITRSALANGTPVPVMSEATRA
jgi:branched-chain amino acid aminotransferase